MGGWGYSFSMWQMWQMWQMLSKCILPHFAAHLPYFAADFLLQKPYLCTEFQSALKLQTIKQEFQLNFSAEHKYNENEWVIT